MMSILTENPGVVVKRKNIQSIIDFCLDQKIECRIIPRTMPEEFDIEFGIQDIMKAVALGMFLKEQKLELNSVGFGAPKSVNHNNTTSTATKSTRSKKAAAEKVATPQNEVINPPVQETEPEQGLSFEETPKKSAEEHIFTSSHKEDNDIFASSEDDLFMQN